jgi:hypothetical protein
MLCHHSVDDSYCPRKDEEDGSLEGSREGVKEPADGGSWRMRWIVDCGSEVEAEAEAEVEGEQGVGCDARWAGEAGSWQQLAASGREFQRVENVD